MMGLVMAAMMCQKVVLQPDSAPQVVQHGATAVLTETGNMAVFWIANKPGSIIHTQCYGADGETVGWVYITSEQWEVWGSVAQLGVGACKVTTEQPTELDFMVCQEVRE